MSGEDTHQTWLREVVTLGVDLADPQLVDVLPHFVRGGKRAVPLNHWALLALPRCFGLQVHRKTHTHSRVSYMTARVWQTGKCEGKKVFCLAKQRYYK